LGKKRAAPPPPTPRPLLSAISTQALKRITDSEESSTSDIEPSKPSLDIGALSKAISSDIDCPKVVSNIGINHAQSMRQLDRKLELEIAPCKFDCGVQQNCHTTEANPEARSKSDLVNSDEVVEAKVITPPVEATPRVEQAKVATKRVGQYAPLPKPRKNNSSRLCASESLKIPKHQATPPLAPPRTLSIKRDNPNVLLHKRINSKHVNKICCSTLVFDDSSSLNEYSIATFEPERSCSKSKDDCASFNKDEINQKKVVPETIDNITAKDDTSLKSSRYSNLKVKSNFNTQNCVKLIDSEEEEARSKSKGKFLSKDKFCWEKTILLDIAENMENRASLNLNQCLRNKKPTVLDSIKLNASPAKCNVDSKKDENNSLEQDDKIKSKNIDSCNENENQRDNLRMTLDDSSLKKKKSVIKLDRMTEPKSERLKLFYPKDVTCGAAGEKNDSEKDKKMCTVISTIPKCERLDATREDGALNNIAKRVIAENINQLCEKRQNYHSEESSGVKNAKRTRVVRSQSKSDDFEMDILKRQRRHLTYLPPEDIAHALNLNVPARNPTSFGITKKNWEQIVTGPCTGHARNTDIDEGDESYGELITAVYQDIPSETDILLQKVSDSLSLVLPTLSSSSVPEPSLPLETSYTTTSVQTNVAAVPTGPVIELEPIETKNELYRTCIDFSVKNGSSASTPNTTTANSQQDISDYYESAMSKDLSISDWEYQLPAPPSAFRDSHSPIFNDYDDTVVTLGSVEAFKEPIASPIVELTDTIDGSNNNSKSTKNLSNNVKVNCNQEALNEKMDLVSEKEIDIKQKPSQLIVKQALITSSQKSETNSDLRKQMLSELENKIETGTLAQIVNKDFDRRNIDGLSAPELAPVDNTLSNFTITTYTRQKSLDIFKELEESIDCTRNSKDKFIKTFAMLSRTNTGACNYDKRNATKNTYLINNLSHSRKATNKSKQLNANNVDYKIEPKIRDQQGELHYKWQSFNATNDKTNIQRSKSYISMTNNTKYQKEAQGIDDTRKHEEPQIESEITGMKKSTSITDLNVETLRDNCVKFSQWRINILKNQEEPTKEEQLQSLQVI
ncbi:uncharacterized protein LOC112464937, partial [Temnothorax curvispinosus]|uniref:Uncharacterized protein LOC112464937 n=1 Tax=Temnothorax curvispinosus TaxID=300111 RepID=A0A6J1R4U6_9HYME